MNVLLTAGLMLGAVAAAPGAAIEHHARLDHHSGSVEARYRATVDVAHRQVGMATAGGRQSTQRCIWRAGVSVEREARHANGAVMRRTLTSDRVIEGSRAGACSAQRDAIAREVAARTEDMRAHLLALAHQDQAELHAELDQLHGSARAS